MTDKQVSTGFWATVTAFFLWGLFPIYFKWIAHVDAIEILAHRVIWSVVFLLLLLYFSKKMLLLKNIFADRKKMFGLLASCICICINWGIFTWAVNADRVLDTSLGYFINPLVSVLLGIVILGERLRPVALLALALAVIGVLLQLVIRGELPWVSLTLAFSFGFYGLIRKMLQVDSLVGLTVETLIALPICIIYAIYLAQTGEAQFLNNNVMTDILLVIVGVVTVIPLALFAVGAKILKLSTVGFIQYLAPSITFALAVFYYDEPFDIYKLTTFIFIWTALLILSWDMFKQNRQAKKALTSS